MDWILAISLGLGAYLMGSTPFAYILVLRVKGADIRHLGTSNVGALNTYQQVGMVGGLAVLLADTAKGALAVLVPAWLDAPAWTVYLTTLLVVAGHNWPVFLKFRGGKGAAAILGVSLALAPVLTFLAAGPAILVMVVTRNVVIGAAFGFIFLNGLLVITGQSAGQLALCASLTLIVTITYVVGIRAHLTGSLRSRRWKELFTGIA